MISWDDASLQVPGDPARRAQYRLLQSWWREHHLGVPPGRSGGRMVGSHLPDNVAEALQNLNFLTEEVRHYVRRRVPEIQAEGGTIDVRRLRGNLLSSQPLAFNIFGHLRAHPAAAAPLLAEVFDTPIDRILRVEVEWAPPRAQHLGDRTAFDAFVAYRVGDERRFLGIEVKYTEPFSATPYDRETYRRLTESCGLFRSGAAERLVAPPTNQLWRQVLLTASLAGTSEFDGGRAAVLSLEDDEGVAAAVAGVRAELLDGAQAPVAATLQHLVAVARRRTTLRAWAEALETRYVDLTPVEHVLHG